MTTIDEKSDLYTLINVFRVAPTDQDRIYYAVLSVTDVIETFPGFVSANVHRSYDGTRVVNYAQWRSREDFEFMQRHSSVQDHFRECRAITQDIDSIFCDVAFVHEAAS